MLFRSINLDFNDVKTVLKDGGVAIMSTGYGEGEGRVKAAMNMLGYKVGTVRAPLTELTDAHKEVLKKALKDYGVL